MFDVTTNKNTVTNKISFNSTSGTLIKSTPDSFFMRFHMNSDMAELMFHTECPAWERQKEWPYTRQKAVVLQVMLCGDNQFLVEYLKDGTDKED